MPAFGLFSQLDNREQAFLFWLVLGLFAASFSKGVRASLAGIATATLSKPVLLVFAAMSVYLATIILAANRLDVWHFDMAKDTIIWAIGPALVMVFNHDGAGRDPHHFKAALVSTLRATVVVGFIYNLYVFHLAIELILLPVLFLLACVLAVADRNAEYASVKRLMQFLLGALGLAILSYAASRIALEFDAFASTRTLESLLLPVALTLAFIPFIYALAIYTCYERISIRITIWVKDQELAGHLRRHVFQTCLFRLARVSRFQNDFLPKLGYLRSKQEVAGLMQDFRASFQEPR